MPPKLKTTVLTDGASHIARRSMESYAREYLLDPPNLSYDIALETLLFGYDGVENLKHCAVMCVVGVVARNPSNAVVVRRKNQRRASHSVSELMVQLHTACAPFRTEEPLWYRPGSLVHNENKDDSSLMMYVNHSKVYRAPELLFTQLCKSFDLVAIAPLFQGGSVGSTHMQVLKVPLVGRPRFCQADEWFDVVRLLHRAMQRPPCTVGVDYHLEDTPTSRRELAMQMAVRGSFRYLDADWAILNVDEHEHHMRAARIWSELSDEQRSRLCTCFIATADPEPILSLCYDMPALFRSHPTVICPYTWTPPTCNDPCAIVPARNILACTEDMEL